MRSIIGVAVLLSVPLVANPASANVAAPWPRPSVVGSLSTLLRTPLRVVAEALEIDCHDASKAAKGRGPRCRFVARYLFANPTGATQRTVAAFYGVRTSKLTITVAKRVVTRILRKGEVAALDRAVERTYGSVALHRRPRRSERQRFGFELSLAAKAKVRVVARGIMHAKRTQTPSSLRRAVVPNSTPRPAQVVPAEYVFRYLIAPIRTWAASPKAIRVTVRCPTSWDLRVRGGGKGKVDARGQRVRRFTVDPRHRGLLELSLRRRPEVS